MGRSDSRSDRRLTAISAKGDPLEAIDRLVPWESFRSDLRLRADALPERKVQPVATPIEWICPSDRD